MKRTLGVIHDRCGNPLYISVIVLLCCCSTL